MRLFTGFPVGNDFTDAATALVRSSGGINGLRWVKSPLQAGNLQIFTSYSNYLAEMHQYLVGFGLKNDPAQKNLGDDGLWSNPGLIQTDEREVILLIHSFKTRQGISL